MIIYGIDPGQKGGIARMVPEVAGRPHVVVHPMMEIGEFADLLTSDLEKEVHVWLEKAQAMPGNPGKSMFSYGMHYGEIRGMLQVLKIPFTEVRPQTWTRVIHAGTKGDDPKKRTLEAVKKLFPGVSLIPPGCRVPHLGLVDALAICEHGRRILRA